MTTHLAEKMGIAKGGFEEPAWLKRSRETGARVWTPVTAPKRLPRHPFQEIAEHAMCGVGANLDVVPSREAVRPYLGVVGPSYKDVMDRLFDAAEELRGADDGKIVDGFSNVQAEQYDDAVYVWFPDVPYADYFDEY